MGPTPSPPGTLSRPASPGTEGSSEGGVRPLRGSDSQDPHRTPAVGVADRPRAPAHHRVRVPWPVGKGWQSACLQKGGAGEGPEEPGGWLSGCPPGLSHQSRGLGLVSDAWVKPPLSGPSPSRLGSLRAHRRSPSPRTPAGQDLVLGPQALWGLRTGQVVWGPANSSLLQMLVE